MAFSQSFEFGDSTLLRLENEACTKGKNSQPSTNGLDIIQESPPVNGAKRADICRRLKNTQVNQSSANTTCQIFQLNNLKDSFTAAGVHAIKDASENYSQYFKDDFSCVDTVEPEETNVRLSEFESTFEEAALDNGVSVFEEQICTEDVQNLLDSSTESHCDKNSNNGHFEEPQSLDESCFVCPAKDALASQQLENDLRRSHYDLILSNQNSQDLAQATQNLSSMSPNQLHFSPTCPSFRDPDSERSILPEVTEKDILDLEALKHIASWNLPHSVLCEYKKKGVIKMFDWQVECLSKPKVLFEHCNLVYSAPTSAGKTLVSEILLLKTVLERQKKALLILPFISVVREKMFYLQDLLTTAGYRVEGFFGGYTPPGGFDSIHVAICTIEKANSIVNKLLEQGKLDEIGTVIVDEVHLISDPGRGYILELLLAKILYMSRKHGLQIQVITMSATLANVQLLQRWLQAELYITDYRPVALQEMIKVGNKIFDNNLKFVRNITETNLSSLLSNDSDNVAQLCIETLLEGCSVIVFCPSKDWCENLAVQLATTMHGIIKSGNDLSHKLRAQLNTDAIKEVKQQLRDIPTGLDGVLSKAMTYACAFHHAGLTTEERDIVEASFKAGVLKVIVATSTLSSGVNLPARRVLIRSPLFGGKQMSSLTYRQMIGRAGRTGKDTLGESILICTDNNARIGRELITADLKPISSCLDMDSSTHLKRALLEVISSGVAATKEDINSFVNCTLLSAQKNFSDAPCDEEQEDANYISDALDFLVEYEFVRVQIDEETEANNYVATRLGAACLASSMPPADGLILFAELQKCRRCFVLESELHAIYLVTPYSVCYQLQDIDWLLYLDMWEKLSPAMKKVGELVGVKESFLVRAMRGQAKMDYKLMQIHKRFYTALALQELVNETPINVVGHKFKCTRGMLQSLQQMASTFAGIVTAFCNSLQWPTLALIVSQFKDRLYFGIHRDLIDLMRLPDLSQKRARALYEAGITNLVELAGANTLALEKVLFNSLSFDSTKQHDNEDAYEAAQRNLARNFFITGKAGMTVAEAAKLLISEARQFVQYDIGVDNIKWTQVEGNSDALKASDSGMEVELHMSLEEEEDVHKINKQKRRLVKEEPSCSVSPPKIKKKSNVIEQPQHKEPKTVANKVIDVDTNQIRSDGRSAGKKIDQSKHKASKTFANKDVDVGGNQIRSEVDAHCAGNRSAIEVVEKECNQGKEGEVKASKENTKLHTHAPSKTTGNALVNTKSNNIALKHLNDHKNVKDTPKLSVVLRSKISNAKSEVEERPSTSAAVRKELLQKEIEERRHIALMRINKKRAEMENIRRGLSKDSPVERHPGSSPPLPQSYQSNKENVDENNVPKPFKTPADDKTITTPTSTRRAGKLTNTPTQLPRRSPRNHQGSDRGKKSSTKPESELFIADDSFILNTDLVAAIKESENKSSEKSTLRKSNSDIEEIPNSQPKETCDENETNNQAPQTSRLMRTYQLRSQRLNSPKHEVKAVKVSPAKSPNKENSSDSASGNASSLVFEVTQNSLLKHPLQLNASHILSCSKSDENAASFSTIDVVDICGDKELFEKAFKEIHAAQKCGFSLGLQRQVGKSELIIGANLLINQMGAEQRSAAAKKTLFHIDNSSFIAGIAICLADNIIWYMNMQEEHIISSDVKVQQLCKLMSNKQLTLLMHDGKEQLKTLMHALPQLKKINAKVEDPKVANWLLQPDKTLSFHNMSQQFAPECLALVELCGTGRGYSSYGLDASTAILPKVRASIEACVTMHILKEQIENLERIGTGQLLKFFREVEMPVQISLCQMECFGFPVKEHRLQSLFQKMLNTMKKLEAKIYELHGSRFNLGSTQAVAKVLGLHRKSNGRVSTSYQILSKLDSPISQFIILYRKVSATLSKNIQPLLKSCKSNRVYGQSITYTATGRISMSEPNLQNVTKDFDVDLGNEKLSISCRSAFAPTDQKCCLLSADFCQLEMRILAHLSQDPSLLDVMNSPQDLFTAIAAHWNKIAEAEVSEQVRNNTKQICYGIVYGMGMRSLSDALKCSEQEALLVSEQFHAAYPGIRSYTVKVVKFARNNGYVETITGRRRYLDHINSGETQLKSHAERQAINSTIQGSAADVAKTAILRMEKYIERYQEKLGICENSVNLVLHLHDELIFEVPADKAKKIAKILRLTMENCVKLTVPLKVKLKIGPSWGELQEVKV